MYYIDSVDKILNLYQKNGGILVYNYNCLIYEKLTCRVTDHNRYCIICKCNKIKYISNWWWHPFNPLSFNNECKILVLNNKCGWIFTTKKSLFFRFINLPFMYLFIKHVDITISWIWKILSLTLII